MDNSPTNKFRANRALLSIRVCTSTSLAAVGSSPSKRGPYDEDLIDCLADMAHLAAQAGLDFQKALGQSEMTAANADASAAEVVASQAQRGLAALRRHAGTGLRSKAAVSEQGMVCQNELVLALEDLRHASKSAGFSFGDSIRIALDHYEEERLAA